MGKIFWTLSQYLGRYMRNWRKEGKAHLVSKYVDTCTNKENQSNWETSNNIKLMCLMYMAFSKFKQNIINLLFRKKISYKRLVWKKDRWRKFQYLYSTRLLIIQLLWFSRLHYFKCMLIRKFLGNYGFTWNFKHQITHYWYNFIRAYF